MYCDHSTTHTLNDEAYSSCFISQEKSRSRRIIVAVNSNNVGDMVDSATIQALVLKVSLDFSIWRFSIDFSLSHSQFKKQYVISKYIHPHSRK